jgi:uncharacterized membrane protein YcgQ (UPF0703/DUF1980 family)
MRHFGEGRNVSHEKYFEIDENQNGKKENEGEIRVYVCLSLSVYLLLRSIASQVDYKVFYLAIKMSSTLSLQTTRVRKYIVTRMPVCYAMTAKYATVQRPVNSNRGTGFSVRSVPRYKQGQLSVAVSQSENCWGSVLVSCCC